MRIAPTTFVGPGDPLPTLEGEVVVKPTVSARARGTGRFAPARNAEAPLTDDPHGPAAVMFEDDLVVAGQADAGRRDFAAAVMAAVTARFAVPLYARVDIAADADGRPVLMELEAIEPNLYLATAPGAAARFARAALTA